ncbi:MAG: anaerobic ribonucleoside-triphosphate reductase activating protein [Sphaerochaetaceae bacterium]
MKFAGLTKSTLLDFPGTLACIVFTSGCPFDCFYCHNREAIEGSSSFSFDEIRAFLLKRRSLLEGVVITGGEPTIQQDLPDFLIWLHSLGYKVKLDTNGCNPSVFSSLCKEGLLDYAAVDYKAPKARYKEICGSLAEASIVLETIGVAVDSSLPFEIRTTMAPTLTLDDLKTMREELFPVLKGSKPFWRLNKYHMPASYKREDETRVQGPFANEKELEAWQTLLRF